MPQSRFHLDDIWLQSTREMLQHWTTQVDRTRIQNAKLALAEPDKRALLSSEEAPCERACVNTPSWAPLGTAPGHCVLQAGAVGTGCADSEVRSARSSSSSALNGYVSFVRLHYFFAHQVPYVIGLQHSPHLIEWDADVKASQMVSHSVNSHKIVTRISPIKTPQSTSSPSGKHLSVRLVAQATNTSGIWIIPHWVW